MGGQGRCNREVKFLWKLKKNCGGSVRGWGGGGGFGLGGQGGCERRIEVFVKIQKKNWGVRGGGVWLGGGGGQGRCDRRIEVFGKIHQKKISGGGVGSGWGGGGGGGSGWMWMKNWIFCEISKKKFFFFYWGGGGGGGGSGLGGQVGCDRRIEVFGKIDKKKSGGGARGVRWGSGCWGVRVDVKEELKFFVKIQKKIFFFGGGSGAGGRVGGGQCGCERRIEVFWKIHKKKSGGGVGRGGVRWGVGLVGGSGWM